MAHNQVPIDSIYDGVEITPNDSSILLFTTRGIYIAQDGDLSVQMQSGAVLLFRNLAGGIVHPIRAIKVFATGTTATGILGLR